MVPVRGEGMRWELWQVRGSSYLFCDAIRFAALQVVHKVHLQTEQHQISTFTNRMTQREMGSEGPGDVPVPS